MNKKLLVVLIIMIFLVTGCSSKKINNQSNKLEKRKEEKEIINIDGFEYNLTLTKSSSFQKAHFKYPKNTIVNSIGTHTILEYNNEAREEFLFKIAITSFDEKTIEEVMEGATTAIYIEDKTYNGITWKVYEFEGRHHNYACNYDNDTYTISFMYDEDLEMFEDNFMNAVIMK